jgi:hypothetical protein
MKSPFSGGRDFAQLFSEHSSSLPLGHPMSRNLRQLIDQAAKEQDLERLCQLVSGINTLLDIIEKRVAEIERRSGTEGN